MAAGYHTYIRGNVWSPEVFQGDRVVVVSVRGDTLTHQRKLQYVTEFGCPTAFLHDALPGQPRRAEMYDPMRGMVLFGGTQLLGTCMHIFNHMEKKRDLSPVPTVLSTTTVLTPSLGEVTLRHSVTRMVNYIVVPHQTFRVLSLPSESRQQISSSQLLNFQPQLSRHKDLTKDLPASHPIAGLFPGQEAPLIDLTSVPDLLQHLDAKFIPPTTISRPTTIIFYVVRKLSQPTQVPATAATTTPTTGASESEPDPIFHDVQIRGLGIDRIEETASTAGACTLAAYLALKFANNSNNNIDTEGTDTTSKSEPTNTAQTLSTLSLSPPPPTQPTSSSSPTSTNTQPHQPHHQHHVFNITQTTLQSQPPGHKRTSQMAVEVLLDIDVDDSNDSDDDGDDEGGEKKKKETKRRSKIRELTISGRAMMYFSGMLERVY